MFLCYCVGPSWQSMEIKDEWDWLKVAAETPVVLEK